MNCGNLGGAEAEIFHETLIWSKNYINQISGIKH